MKRLAICKTGGFPLPWLIYFNFKKMFYLSLILIIHSSKNFTPTNYNKYCKFI